MCEFLLDYFLDIVEPKLRVVTFNMLALRLSISYCTEQQNIF